MRTAEQIKNKIKQLETELYEVEITSKFVERLDRCKVTDGKHDWRMRSWERNIPYEPIYTTGYFMPIAHEVLYVHEKAQMYCRCGARVTYEEGGR